MQIRAASLFSCIASLILVEEGTAFTSPLQNPNTQQHDLVLRSDKTKLNGGIMDFLNEGKKAVVKKLAGDYDASAIQQRINGLISENPAKAVLDDLGAKYTVVELDTDPEGKAIRAELGDLIGRTSVPAIWINAEFVGGCNDGPLGGIITLKDNGKLTGMLKGAGSL